jgi:hypothetical protein
MKGKCHLCSVLTQRTALCSAPSCRASFCLRCIQRSLDPVAC